VTRSAEPDFSARAVGLVTVQGFSAKDTFNGIFGSAVGPFWGGGAQIVLRSGIYAEVNVSRFRKDGDRAFLANGDVARLGFPLTATITPVEVTGGYRVRLRRHASLIPYVGAGVGSYGYRETSDSSDEDVSTRHVGYLAVGGVEYRVHSWIGIAADLQYTHIPGILGSGGISEQAGENDLGGTAARFRIVVGR
jgi:opacity protein-like surface antigen